MSCDRSAHLSERVCGRFSSGEGCGMVTTNSALSFRFPELDWISFRIIQTSKPPVGINLRIDGDLDLRGTKLFHDGIEIPNAKVNHPVLIRIAEVIATARKRSKDRRSCFLRPGLLI